MDDFAPPEDPIELYKYDHIDERGTLRYYADFARFFYDNPSALEKWKPWQRLKQFELLAVLAAIVGLFFQIQATNEARQQFTDEMQFNREQWEEQRVSNAWALVAAATDPTSVGNIGARFALETLNGKGEWLTDVRLPGANLRRANLEGANLFGANLKDADLSVANLKGANLGYANLEGAHLRVANLEGADLFGANLKGADLSVANLKGASLWGANLEGADLVEANLEGADLFGANLKGADLSVANLKGASLRVANLEGADLVEANLEGAILLEANLEGADLRRANLEGADLRRANLEGAQGLDCNGLKKAKSWELTYRDEAHACGESIPEKPADYFWNDPPE